MKVDTPLLIIGGGPGALAAAEIASGFRLPSLVVGHVAAQGPNPEYPVPLDEDAVAALEHHGVLGVLRPYLAVQEPPTVSPHVFEDIVKHHCVADMNVTVYDAMEVVELQAQAGSVSGVLTDGRARWELHADAVIDTRDFPSELSAAVNRASTEVAAVLSRLTA
ncbi:MAG: hypothetical protein ACKV2O_20050 [Acidimicrobiales bacterium]